MGRSQVALVLLALASAACTTSYPTLSFKVEQRILRETTLDDLPEGHAAPGDAVVRVVRTGKLSGACSGALIGRRHVLTAQHCVTHGGAQRELTWSKASAGDLHVELGGGYLPWGRVGVREIHACEGYRHDLEHDVAVLVLSRSVPPDVPTLEITYAPPDEAAVYTLAGFGSRLPPRAIPRTGWAVSSVTRHEHRGPVLAIAEGHLEVRVPGVPGDSGGPIVDSMTGRIAAVVSRGRAASESADEYDARRDDDGRVSGPRLIACAKTISTALAR